ncbi:MAG: ferredoxin--NADP(+) reductase [Rhodospirillaceae bacterium]|nr:ferredoxin--NADP(+) reductase [Rhodospirillaceae bacterium]
MAIVKETVLEVKHYTDRLFHFRTTRSSGTRFRDGEFLMIGLEADGKPLLRAYSVASPNYEDYMEWFSIKVPDGPLTSRLQHMKVGDEVITNTKAVGTLVMDNLKSGRNLYMLATGTGVAPFMSLVRGLETYEKYEKVILLWSTREVKELAFMDMLENLNNHPVWGEVTQGNFLFYPSVTREDFKNTGRITDAIFNGSVYDKLGVPVFDKNQDSAMICGSIEMNMEFKRYFEDRLGCVEGSSNTPGDFVLEKSFVEK